MTHTIGRLNYRSLGTLENHQKAAQKDQSFKQALISVQELVIFGPQGSVSHLVRDVFDTTKTDTHLEDIRQALRPNSQGFGLWKKEFSVTGQKLLAYLAVLENPECLNADGTLNVDKTEHTMRALLGDTQNTIPLDRKTFQNIKLNDYNGEKGYVFGKNRRATVEKDLSSTQTLFDLKTLRQNLRIPETEALRRLAALKALPEEERANSPLAMATDLDKIPTMKRDINALNSSEIALGDMHGNAHLFLHELVQTGHLTIQSEEKWQALTKFLGKATPQFTTEDAKRLEKLEADYNTANEKYIHWERIANIHLKKGTLLFTEMEKTEYATLKEKGQDALSEEDYNKFMALKRRAETQEFLKFSEEPKKEAVNSQKNAVDTEKKRIFREKHQLATMQELSQAEGARPLSAQEMKTQFETLLSQAVSINEKAKDCTLVLLGDLLGDRGRNDLFNLGIFGMLKTAQVNYKIIFSNHDGEFMAWYHAGCDLRNLTKDHSTLGADAGGQGAVSSLIALDTLCQQDLDLKVSVDEQIKNAYLPYLNLFDTSPSGEILYTHAPGSAENFDELYQDIGLQQEKNTSFDGKLNQLKTWFVGIIPDKNKFEEVFKTQKNNSNYFFKALMAFVNFGGGSDRDIEERKGLQKEQTNQFNLALPPGKTHNIHGHVEKLMGIGKDGKNPLSETGQLRYTNFECHSQYSSLDGETGMSDQHRQGTRFLFAIPKKPAQMPQPEAVPQVENQNSFLEEKLHTQTTQLENIKSREKTALEKLRDPETAPVMEIDFTKIPTMKQDINVSNSTEIAFGDMHGNAQLFLHKLVQTGYFTIQNEGQWNTLNTLINKTPLTVEDLQLFDTLLAQAVTVNPQAKNCRLVPLGDLLADRGQNDYFTLGILDKLREGQISYAIPFSDHDRDFVAWHLNGYQVTGLSTTQKSGLDSMLGQGQNTSLVHLDNLVYNNSTLKKILSERINRAYLPNVELLATSTGGQILYSHAPISDTLLESVFKELLTPRQRTLPFSEKRALLNQKLQDILYDKTLFQKLFWKKGDELSPLLQLLWERKRGKLSNNRTNLHGHDHDLEKNGTTAQHLSLDQDGGKSKGQTTFSRTFFAIPKEPAAQDKGMVLPSILGIDGYNEE